jgi:phospholipase C
MKPVTLMALFVLAGCSSAAFNPTGQALGGSPASVVKHSSPIQHIVLIVQENRSFDNFFATFPGADGTKTGKVKLKTGDRTIKLEQVTLAYPCDIGHGRTGYLTDYDNGKMDAFNLQGNNCAKGSRWRAPYQYVAPKDIAPYWDIAKTYVLGDHLFQTQGSGSFTAHQDLIAGATLINPSQSVSLVDFPTGVPWGCDAPSGTVTSILTYVSGKLKYGLNQGPYPCLSYETMRDLLDNAHISWRYYSAREPNGAGAIWDGFDAINAVRNGPEWKANVITPPTRVLTDISSGNLAQMSWVTPDAVNSDHPGTRSKTGPSWVASIVNAIGQSPYWSSTAIVVVWDDWGGFYDHVPPPFIDTWGGLGFRVPLLIVSPYARTTSSSQPGYISHTQYEFGSILKFIEETFNLPSLHTSDSRATSISDCFDFSQSPRTFVEIPASYSREYFERQPQSSAPVDTE